MSEFKDIGLNDPENKRAHSANSDMDKLTDDFQDTDFKGGTLSLSQDQDLLTNTPSASNPSSVDGALENAAEHCRPVVLENIDGELRGVWLLTEIDHWDNEKERLIFLTDHTLISLKYDFIAQKLLEYKRYPVTQFDQIVVGELKYPEKSLMPRINEAVGFVKEQVIPKIRQIRPNSQPGQPPLQSQNEATDKANLLVPSPRHQNGIKCLWNQGQPLPLLKNWNPWSREIPWITFTSHPLVCQEGGNKAAFDVNDFTRTFVQQIERKGTGNPESPKTGEGTVKKCQITYEPIVIENYAGLASAFHNANQFGFFKLHDEIFELHA
ncbi:tumor protein p63-regulated gene 1-like protein [Limulus polyphemus]|uniref:Tumor protein p63-regulated gene 1-like protein n=1 Tax=Limulus polyphemus TaxID=6850 RepID=A0ABM1TNG7_LIMPO|nr:tumor protein p63-regulated gene 1-like protein [Limulus polyphemus]